MKEITKVMNDTTHVLIISQFTGELFRQVIKCGPKEAVTIRPDFAATYRSYSYYSIPLDNWFELFSTDDCREAEEIIVYETLERTIGWRISKARGFQQPQRPSANIQEFAAFKAKRKVASSRIDSIDTFCGTFEKHLQRVKICPAQCTNVVQTCLEGINRIRGTYSALSVNDMWLLYSAEKLPHLLSSLDRILSTLESTKGLLDACGRQWGKMGLVLSIPLPPLGMKTYSKFDLLLKEFSWNVDTICYVLHKVTGELESKRNEIIRRYVPKRNDMIGVAAAEETNLMGSERLVCEDRAHFLFNLQNKSLLISDNSFSHLACHLAWELFSFKFAANLLRESFAAVLERRLQVERLEELSSECMPVPDCFRIDHGDLKPRTRLSGDLERGSKAIYKGEWFGHEVAIGIVRGTERVAVEREAAVMLTVQHPHIVEFLGWAFTDDAPSPASNGKPDDHCTAGYLVMELMEENLRSLILRCNRKRPEGPFPVAVAVDILLQIVGAMIHMHNCKIMYRDLKSENCLVNLRPSSKSSPEVFDLYTVKLIDFETSKMLNPDDAKSNHSLMKGTCRWMAPEVWRTRRDEQFAPYEMSADVYSFGMTCYEVISGLLPFHKYTLNTDIKSALDKGDRPLVPASVSCPRVLEELMSKCWDQEPSARPDFQDIEKALWDIKCELELQ